MALSERTKFAAANVFLFFAGECVFGTAANVFVMLTGFISTLSGIGGGEITADESAKIWFSLAFVAMLVCGVGMFYSAESLARRSLSFNKNNSGREELDVPLMFTAIFGGGALHALLCVLMSFRTMQILYIAAPVMYIARLINKSPHTLFTSDGLIFPPSVVVSSVAVYSAILTAVSFAGYLRGHSAGIAELREKEKNDILMSRKHSAE